MTVLIGNMGDTVVRTVREATDWTGRKTRVLPEYQHERPSEILKKDQTSSTITTTTATARECTRIPSLAGRTSPLRPSLTVESPLETRDEQQQHPSGQSNKKERSEVQAEAILLAREISKLAKDVCEQPPKKYKWEEWVNWLKVLGDEAWVARRGGVKGMELNRSETSPANANASASASANLDPHQQHHDVDHQRHPNKHHRRYHSQPDPHPRIMMENADGAQADWNWTWLDDKGPLFSPETETEWILTRLCSRLEHLLNESHT